MFGPIPSPKLDYLAKIVSRMKPGEHLVVDRFDLSDIPTYHHNDALFTAADRILGNIMGSAYTHSFSNRPDGSVEFVRHHETGERFYKEPDHAYRVASAARKEPT